MTSFSTKVSQQNAQSVESKDKAQPVYTDIDRDKGEKRQEDILEDTSLGEKTKSRLRGQLLTGGGYLYMWEQCGNNEKTRQGLWLNYQAKLSCARLYQLKQNKQANYKLSQAILAETLK